MTPVNREIVSSVLLMAAAAAAENLARSRFLASKEVKAAGLSVGVACCTAGDTVPDPGCNLGAVAGA